MMGDDAIGAGLPAVMERMVGQWAGTSRLWMEPGQLSDEAQFKGEIAPILGGRFLRFSYSGPVFKDPTEGLAVIGYNAADDQVEMCWLDSWHNGQAQMFCLGHLEPTGFSVLGYFPERSSGTLWGWRTRFELTGSDRLTVTAIIITPQGEEAKAVESAYDRIH
jgi:hypothetical protein